MMMEIGVHPEGESVDHELLRSEHFIHSMEEVAQDVEGGVNDMPPSMDDGGGVDEMQQQIQQQMQHMHHHSQQDYQMSQEQQDLQLQQQLQQQQEQHELEMQQEEDEAKKMRRGGMGGKMPQRKGQAPARRFPMFTPACSLRKSNQEKISLKDKHEMILMAQGGASQRAIAKHFQCSHVSVGRILKQKQEILNVASTLDEETAAKQTRVTRKVAFPELEKDVLTWYRRQRGDITGKAIKAQAAVVFKEKYPNEAVWTPTDGWLHKFKSRHGIYDLKGSLVKIKGKKSLQTCALERRLAQAEEEVLHLTEEIRKEKEKCAQAIEERREISVTLDKSESRREETEKENTRLKHELEEYQARYNILLTQRR